MQRLPRLTFRIHFLMPRLPCASRANATRASSSLHLASSGVAVAATAGSLARSSASRRAPPASLYSKVNGSQHFWMTLPRTG